MANFAASQPDPDVNHPPYFASGTVTNGSNVTITFDNVTEMVEVTCTSGGTGSHALLVGVSTAGVEGTARLALGTGNSTGKMLTQVKQIVLRGGGADCGYQLVAVLSRQDSASYPDLTTANGFAGV